MDAARTAKRLGAEEAIVVYRRTRDRMPAHDFEVEEAEDEGIQMKWLSTVKHADGGKLVLERMELDEDGFPQPTGEYEELEADSLVLALGQESDVSVYSTTCLASSSTTAQSTSTPDLMTGHPGIFAGGDIIRAERTVTVGVGHGKTGRALDRRLAPRAALRPEFRWRSPATFDQLNTWYYSDAPRAMQPMLEMARRRSTFEEVVGGLDEDDALFSRRAGACRAATASTSRSAGVTGPASSRFVCTTARLPAVIMQRH